MTNNEKKMLAIECTAHTFGAAVVDTGYNILSNEKDSLSDEKGGLIPVKILEHHIKVASNAIENAMAKANVMIDDIGYLAVSNSPGMGHALRTGNIIAKAISQKNNIPIIPVNHSLSHLTSAMINAKDRSTTLLYAAGANTQIYNYDNKRNKMMLVGETLDIGIGHLLDIIARDMGLGFPGGPKIERIADKYSGKALVELPYNIKGMDVVFGGLSTRARQVIRENKVGSNNFNDNEINANDSLYEDEFYAKLCFSVQEYAFSALLEATERAAALNGSECIAVIGGVALNSRFQKMAEELCSERNVKLIIPKKGLLADNAAMIGLEAARELGTKSCRPKVFSLGESLRIAPYERLKTSFNYTI